MASIEERLATIQKSVMEEAQGKSAAIRRQADNLRKKELEKAENEVLQELYNRIQEEISDIHGTALKNVSKQEGDLRRDLLLRREEITNSVFHNVKTRLIAYTATAEYEKHFLETAQRLAKEHPYSDSTIQVRRQDYAFASKLDEIFGKGCRIIVSDNIEIGGLRLMNQLVGVFVDETLDNRLREQRPWFYSNSGLTVV